MTTAQVVETSITVNKNNSPIQDYVHSDDQIQPKWLLGSNLSQQNWSRCDLDFKHHTDTYGYMANTYE